MTQFSNVNNPAATFTKAGGPGFYVLRWTVSNVPCVPASTDDVILSFADAPVITKAFAPAAIMAGATSAVTLTLNNSANPVGLVGSFSDTLANMSAVGGTVGGTCAKLSAITLPANATGLSFTGIALPANGSCTVTFPVSSTVIGVQPNTTSGVTTDFTPTAGAASNTVNLTVTAPTMPTVVKAFSPATITAGATSTVSLTLSNTRTFGVLGSLTDTLTNMTAVGGPLGSTCGTLSAITIPANATNLSFSGIVIPGSGSCTVSFAVRSTVPGVHPNTTSGVTTDQSTLAGPVSNTANLTVNAAGLTTRASKAVHHDFDGDGKSDLAQWRKDLGEWQVAFSSNGSSSGSGGELHHIQLIEPNDKDEYLAVAADFDGDHKTDAAVWRSRDGRWLIKQSSDGELIKAQFGLTGDTPMSADYDGDGRADLGVWRKSESGLHILRSSDQTAQAVYLGELGDLPVIGDFDGDGRMDVAVFRAGEGRWLLRDTATGMLRDVTFGQAGDVPMAGDYDGDGKADLAVRTAQSEWQIHRSTDGETTTFTLGAKNDQVVIGDFDGDGLTDAGAYRASDGRWLIRYSRNGVIRLSGQNWNR